MSLVATDKDGNVIEIPSYESSEVELEVHTEWCSKEARWERDQLLLSCDWTVGADSPLSDEKKAEWRTYRQALRDITSADGFPFTHEFPEKP